MYTVNLPNGEASVDFIELIAYKAQVGFHTRNIGIGKVAAVKLHGSGVSKPVMSQDNANDVLALHQTYIVDQIT